MNMRPRTSHMDHEISWLPEPIVFDTVDLRRESVHFVLLDEHPFLRDIVQVIEDHVLCERYCYGQVNGAALVGCCTE